MANTIYFDPTHDRVCVLGHKYDHKVTTVHFNNFEQTVEDSTIYFKLQTKANNYLIPLSDYEWLVTQPATSEAGEFWGQLVEIKENDDSEAQIIRQSEKFKVIIKRSVKDGYEVTDPTLDLWMTKVTVLYNKYFSDGQYLDNIVSTVKEMETNAKTSETNAKASEKAAGTSAGNAAASATDASTSAQEASDSADRAEQAANTKGWLFVEGSDDGILYAHTSDSFTDGMKLIDDGNGVLEVELS